MDYLIKNGTVVNEGKMTQRDVAISNGIIVEAVDPESAVVVDASGCIVMPGVIDTHVHFREPGLTNKADMGTESRAAIAGGVTSIIDMPNTLPQTTTLEYLEEKERIAEEKCLVNYGFMLGATNENIEQLTEINPARYAAIKLFLGSSTGNMLVNNEEKLNLLFSKARKLIVAHCEEESIIEANLEKYRSHYAGSARETAALHPKIRSSEACFVSTKKAVARAKRYGTRFHVAHISTAAELDLLSNQTLEEKLITAEVTPNHLRFNDTHYAKYGNLIKCNPSIKSSTISKALWNALCNGYIDTIATDHAPHLLEDKQKPYFSAPSGIPSIQHSLLMMMEMISGNNEDFDQWMPMLVYKMCHNPATLFGIKNRGFIRTGYAADLVVVKRHAQTIVTPESLYYKCGWSPLTGQNFQNRIIETFINGEPFAEGRKKAQPLQFEK